MVLKYIIVLEGPDGVGKTTQGKKIVEYLNSNGINCKMVKARVKPTSSYKFISEIETSYENSKSTFPKWLKATLIAYERAKQIYDIIMYSTEDIIIFDKYIYSTPLYLDYKLIDKEFSWKILQWLPKPNLVVFFGLDPDICMQRIVLRGEKIGNNENIEFLSKIMNEMPELIQSLNVPFKYIDAKQEEDEIFNELRSAIVQLLEEQKNVKL